MKITRSRDPAGQSPLSPPREGTQAVEKLACKQCGASMERPRTGRPPRYCSTLCRRATEYELRRAQQLLARAERAEQDARRDAVFGANPQHQARIAAWWAAEVDRLGEQLLELLEFDDGAGDTDEQ